MHKQKVRLTQDQFDQINDLYWEHNYSQPELAVMFGITQPHISKIVNGKVHSYHISLAKKLFILNENIIPNKNEPKQASVLRAKRHQLHNTKLSWSKATTIRNLYFSGRFTEQQLAQKYGVNQSTISKLIVGYKWKRIGL